MLLVASAVCVWVVRGHGMKGCGRWGDVCGGRGVGVCTVHSVVVINRTVLPALP